MSNTQRAYAEMKMTPEELDEFLRNERICRVATLSARGPHVSPLWFVWTANSIWLKSIIKSRRWADLERDPRTSIVVDSGHDLGELRGVQLSGKVEQVGEAPRQGEPNEELEAAERLFNLKYFGTDKVTHDDVHAWLRLSPDQIVSWDFTKGDWGEYG